jgi:hypothetical protein
MTIDERIAVRAGAAAHALANKCATYVCRERKADDWFYCSGKDVGRLDGHFKIIHRFVPAGEIAVATHKYA